MALFTDGISTIQDLMNQDSYVLATAQTENINLAQKLVIAQQELGIELTTSTAKQQCLRLAVPAAAEPAVE